LLCDIRDQIDHLTNPLNSLRQALNGIICSTGLLHGSIGHTGGMLYLPGNLVDRRRKFGRRGGHGLDIADRVFGIARR